MSAKKQKRNPLGLTTLPATVQFLQGAGKGYKKYVANAKGKKPKNPAKFARCVKDVKKKGGANAYAVCTAAGTKKRNTAKLQRTLHKKAVNFKRNRSRMNPEDTAAARYEYFHGRVPKEIIDIETEVHEHSVLSGIGKLLALEIFAIDGSRIVKVEQFKGALLAQDEKGKQLYIEGGDQAVNLSDFGIKKPHELEILGALTSVVYFTTKDHLRPEDGGTAAYDHKFGGEGRSKKHAFGQHGSRLPLVGYDVRNRLLSIQGGGYELPDVGIDG